MKALTIYYTTKPIFSVLLLLLLGGLFALPIGSAQAQTPITKIENAAGDSVFVSFDDGGLLGLGEFGTGTIPASGAGTRMMWYPAKAAFRAGRVGMTAGKEDIWNADSVGQYSIGLGLNVYASGDGSVAMGFYNTASGRNSTAMGNSTTASGDYSLAMGSNTTASTSHSTAMGTNTSANGYAATSMGNKTTASGTNATAMGTVTTASGMGATSMGDGTIAATDNSLAIGKYNYTNTSADNTILVAGNGYSGNRSDALLLDHTGNLTISGTLTENSDRRLKKNIAPLKDGVLGKLAAITPSSFEFKNQQTHPAGPQLGLIAQQVQQQFPELISKAGNGYLSVSYSKFTAVLLKGMQEQQDKIQHQQEEINHLSSKVNEIDNLKAEIASLKDQNNQQAGLYWPLSVLLLLMIIGSGWIWKTKIHAANNQIPKTK